MIHPQVRKAVLDKLKSINSGKIFWYDGRPAFLAPEELPAVA
ncbi:phage tail protein, partial [Klebsiella pneumoniae]